MSFLTLKYNFKCNNNEKKILRFLTHLSKNLYNASLFKMRHEFFNHGFISRYFDYNKIMSTNDNYHLLNTYQSICIIRSCHNMMTNFIENRYKEEVEIPKYLHKYGFYPLYTDQVRPIIHNGKKCIKLPLSNLVRTNRFYQVNYSDTLINTFINELNNLKVKAIYFPIPKLLLDKEIRQVRIVPNKYGERFSIEFSYKEVEKEYFDLDDNTYAGIDVGINNLASVAISNNKSFIMDGKRLKSYNQFFNKRKAKLQSKLPRGKKSSKAINNMYYRRDNYFNDYLNKSVNQVVKELIKEKVKHVVIGYNKGMKKNGIKNDKLKGKKKKKVNQTFSEIPISRFVHKLEFKLKQYHLDVQIINESYTSKASFYDSEEVIKKDSYKGTRIYRGLYKTSKGIKVNADINAALNILSKSNPNLEVLSSLRGRGLTIPNRIQIKL